MSDKTERTDADALLAKALVAALAELKNPTKGATNPHFKNKYADLPAVRDAVVPVFGRHGLAVLQKLGSGTRGPTVTTVILHEAGGREDCGTLEVPASKQDAQGWGSAITYGRRYALLAAANLVGDDDDDGQAATQAPANGRAPQQHQQQRQRPGQAESPQNLAAKLRASDHACAQKGWTEAGEVYRAVEQALARHGRPIDWPPAMEAVVHQEVEKFVAERRARRVRT